MKRDQEIFDLIEKEHQRQLKGMELIASENFVSDEVMEAMGSYLTNKYADFASSTLKFRTSRTLSKALNFSPSGIFTTTAVYSYPSGIDGVTFSITVPINV